MDEGQCTILRMLIHCNPPYNQERRSGQFCQKCPSIHTVMSSMRIIANSRPGGKCCLRGCNGVYTPVVFSTRYRELNFALRV